MKHIQDIWVKKWLVNKPYCYNSAHHHYNPLIDRLVRDLNRGQNRIIIIVGTPRSGKSWFSLWLMTYMNYCYFGKETTVKDIYWKLDDFLEATKNPLNQKKFITLEEQGVEQYAKDFWKSDVMGFDKVTQIFGVDETNIIINLPYIFDLNKGTRLKGHMLLRAFRKSKNRVNVVTCIRRMNMTTEKAYYMPIDTWENVPSIYTINSELVNEYERVKREYNLSKKNELTKKKGGLQPTKIFARLK